MTVPQYRPLCHQGVKPHIKRRSKIHTQVYDGSCRGGDADLHAERRQKSVGEDGELGQGAAGSMTHRGSHSVTRYSHTSQFRREMKWTWGKTGAAIRARGGCGLGLFGLQGSPKLNEGKCAKMFRVGTRLLSSAPSAEVGGERLRQPEFHALGGVGGGGGWGDCAWQRSHRSQQLVCSFTSEEKRSTANAHPLSQPPHLPSSSASVCCLNGCYLVWLCCFTGVSFLFFFNT